MYVNIWPRVFEKDMSYSVHRYYTQSTHTTKAESAQARCAQSLHVALRFGGWTNTDNHDSQYPRSQRDQNKPPLIDTTSRKKHWCVSEQEHALNMDVTCNRYSIPPRPGMTKIKSLAPHA